MNPGKCPKCKIQMIMPWMKLPEEPLLSICLNCGFERPMNHKKYGYYTKEQIKKWPQRYKN